MNDKDNQPIFLSVPYYTLMWLIWQPWTVVRNDTYCLQSSLLLSAFGKRVQVNHRRSCKLRMGNMFLAQQGAHM